MYYEPRVIRIPPSQGRTEEGTGGSRGPSNVFYFFIYLCYMNFFYF